MRATIGICVLAFLAGDVFGQSPDPPIENKRLPVSTLVREDVFAGWRANNMERFARAEKNIELLLEQRPKAKPDLLAWKGGVKLYRAILALEEGDNEKFEQLFQVSRDLFAEARALAPRGPAVAAIVGGSYVVFADRLPEKYQEAAWSESYDNYQILWKQQGEFVEKLPPHISGELLAGLIQSAQRSGRTKEYEQYLDKMVEVLPDTPYGRVARRWKSDPQQAATGNISCKMCHSEGRLSERVALIKDK